MTAASSPGILAVGDQLVSEARVVGEILAQGGVTLPAGLSSTGRVVAELLSPPPPTCALTTMNWATSHLVTTSDTVHADVLITAITANGIERSVHLVDGSGRVREQGTQVWKPTTADIAPVSEAVDFCTVDWGQMLARRLGSDSAFTSSLSTWDGTIGLRCGERELHIRIYRGRIIDVTRRVPHGATFTFVASPRLWTELAFDTDDNFMRRAISGEFSSTGDGYEYLRLTKPLNILMGHVRHIAREARS
ncbi:UNVERIFIED_CONTAM: hypothetical protein DES50_11363 [Williamsia faeni]